MSKVFGHTGTLFLQNGKYYKWSYKHDHCVECGNCNFKHKGRGLCTSCWDKMRANDPRRIETRKRAGKKWHENNYCPVTERKKKPTILTPEDRKAYKKKWYQENRPVMLLKNKIQRRLRGGLPCMKIVIEGEVRYLPFETLEKPKTVTSREYHVWRKRMEEYDLLLAYYRRMVRE